VVVGRRGGGFGPPAGGGPGPRRPPPAHDADPLAGVVAAWVAFYDRAGVRGDLEVAVTETVARWRAGSLELPDYYLVLDPEELAATRRHWFLGYLRDRAPHRVVPAAASPAGLRREVGRLRAGRWWPDLDELLDEVLREVPEAVRLDAAEEADGAAAHGEELIR
jgi:hypothetical protein